MAQTQSCKAEPHFLLGLSSPNPTLEMHPRLSLREYQHVGRYENKRTMSQGQHFISQPHSQEDLGKSKMLSSFSIISSNLDLVPGDSMHKKVRLSQNKRATSFPLLTAKVRKLWGSNFGAKIQADFRRKVIGAVALSLVSEQSGLKKHPCMGVLAKEVVLRNDPSSSNSVGPDITIQAEAMDTNEDETRKVIELGKLIGVSFGSQETKIVIELRS